VPFTVAHAAAVLPLNRPGRRYLPLTALMIGSMAPDFGYFFSHEASRQLTHSLPSLISFSLPAGLVMWLFYIYVLEKATITLLSDRWHTRFAHTDAVTPALILRACIAIVLGAATHIVWDAFTHRGTFITNAIPALTGPTPGFPWLPIYHLLHGISSVVGIVILFFWMKGLHRQPARSQIRPYRISERARANAVWFLAASTVIVGLVHWLPDVHSRYDVQVFAAVVGSLSGFFAAWCFISVGMWIHTRPGRARPS
jgi:hypothetical protein